MEKGAEDKVSPASGTVEKDVVPLGRVGGLCESENVRFSATLCLKSSRRGFYMLFNVIECTYCKYIDAYVFL